MKVCDVVLNSIWYDPRVRKQIAEYLRDDSISISCVGMRCNRYDEEKISMIPCPHTIVKLNPQIDCEQKSVYKKIKREYLRILGVKEAIVNYHPDIIHANDLNALIPSYIAAKKLHCKLIYDSHEINIENYTGSRKSLLSFVMEKFERFLVKRVDLMVCVSNAAADYFEQKYHIPKPMVVTNCSLKRETIFPIASKNPGFEILNHGQFYEGRGYELMIQSAKHLSDYPDIYMSLRGFGRIEESLRNLALECRPENIRFYPKVNVEQLIPEASKSMVGVAITIPLCLNFKLSVSNKIFEYAAAGLPVIMSDVPEHRYLNDKYHFGIVLKENTPECFAEAVKELYENKAFYKECADNSLKMSKELNWENEFSKIIKYEKSILS